MSRPALIAVLTTLALSALALPGGASAAVTQELGVPYGSAIDFDGQREELALDLYRPAERKRPRPAVIWVHGGGFTFGSRIFMTAYAQSFAAKGYVSATISYRLADNGELAQVGFPRAIRAAQHDAQAAVRWLRRHARRLGVDKRRIYIGGHSAGAVTALETGISREDPGESGNPGYSSQVDGAIGIAGLVVDKSQFDRRDAPMLLFHGDADDTVPFSASTEICRAARSVPLGCRLVAYPGGDHYVAYSKFTEIVERSATWLRRRW